MSAILIAIALSTRGAAAVVLVMPDDANLSCGVATVSALSSDLSVHLQLQRDLPHFPAFEGQDFPTPLSGCSGAAGAGLSAVGFAVVAECSVFDVVPRMTGCVVGSGHTRPPQPFLGGLLRPPQTPLC